MTRRFYVAREIGKGGGAAYLFVVEETSVGKAASVYELEEIFKDERPDVIAPAMTKEEFVEKLGKRREPAGEPEKGSPGKIGRGRGVRHCKKCGEPGHRKDGCPNK